MGKVAIIGKYCLGEDATDGQSIKTRIVTREMSHAIGADQILQVDTYNWKKAPFSLFAKSIKAVRRSENVIFMTDQGGIKIFPWLLIAANVLGNCKLHYVVVGGWLVPFLQRNPLIAKCLRLFDAIYVETRAMKSGLTDLHFSNVLLMPNFKALLPLSEEEMSFNDHKPFKFCMFSRVMKEKGIEEAVGAVRAVNNHYGESACELDIYGQVDSNQIDWFDELRDTFPSEIRYCGVIPFDKSVAVIKDYCALLFPTKFYTEGIPGTIIDAYAAGVPVVTSRWENYSDIIEDNRTGVSYPFSCEENLVEILKDIIEHPEKMINMKTNCLKKASEYLPQEVMGILLGNLR